MGFKSKFIILRHCQPKSFPGPWIQPHSNPLSEEGKKQAKGISKLLKEINIDSIYSSPYTRALQTAEIIGKNLELEVKIKEYLKERIQGDIENREIPEKEVKKLWLKFEQFKNLSPKEQWTAKPFRGFETDQELLERSLKCLTEISNNDMGKTILIVSHAGFIKVILINLGLIKLEERDNFKIRVGEFYTVIRERRNYILEN